MTMSWFDYDDYLRISDEIDFNKMASKVEITLLMNELQMDKYNADLCRDKLLELNELVYDVMEMEARAAMHKHHEIYDKCLVYYEDIQWQMNEFVNKLQ
jgi:hypothetical protein